LAADPQDFRPDRGTRDRPAGAARTPMAGRSTEMAGLAGCWDAARKGHGRICLIRGTGGVARSRLAAAMINLMGGQGATVLYGQCSADDPMPVAAGQLPQSGRGHRPVAHRASKESVVTT
jgi:hypothetical protein